MAERPEHRILLACARVCGDSERRELILPCLAEPIDWEYLLATANHHRVGSLVCWHLSATCRDVLPQVILEKLDRRLRKNADRIVYMTAELFRVLSLFEKNCIPAIPFKGPVLANTLYENWAAREFVDLDILVHEQDVFRAIRLLPELGYRKTPNYLPAVEAQILKRQYHFQIEKGDSRIITGIHWKLAPRYDVLPPLPMNKWWGRVESVEIQSRRVPNLCPEDLLMVLSSHGFRHMWRSLGCIADLVRFLHQHPELDWDYYFKEYENPGLQRIIILGQMVACDVQGSALPKQILQKAKLNPVVVQLALEAKERLFIDEGEPGPLPYIRFQLMLSSNWMERFRFCIRIVSTPTLLEWDVRLPRIFYPLYFVLRPIRLLWTYLGRAIFRRI